MRRTERSNGSGLRLMVIVSAGLNNAVIASATLRLKANVLVVLFSTGLVTQKEKGKNIRRRATHFTLVTTVAMAMPSSFAAIQLINTGRYLSI